MYTFAQDLSDPNVLVLCERWRDSAALEAHGKSDHMRAFQASDAGQPAHLARPHALHDGRRQAAVILDPALSGRQ